ncbi:hypothetical protein LZ31DRAFT_153163 [Colletotrichum somersetense]|nr:hypothetical protein LZ31DRAFT_153163 [Colletotrichum somersetense]
MVDASSGSDLDISLFSTATSEEPTAKQQSFVCAKCSGAYRSVYDLDWHTGRHSHTAFSSSAPGCKEDSTREDARDAHQRTPHLQGHGRVQPDHPLACAECMLKFRNNAKLQEHANEAQHSQFVCVCGKTFARLDVLNRHVECLGSDLPKFPCRFCKRHRGKDGFRRRDLLLQHIRGYHKFETEENINGILPSRQGKHLKPSVCFYPGCPKYRDDSFAKLGPEEQKQDKAIHIAVGLHEAHEDRS